jgi:transposase
VRERAHLQAILLRMQGWRTPEVARVCGFRDDWIRQLVRRYNADGPESLGDGRQRNGKKPILSADLLQELRRAVLDTRPRSGGLWTGPKVAHWMSEKLNRPVSPQLAWDYLQRLKMSKQTPRPRHAKANAKAQEDFKKTFVAG